MVVEQTQTQTQEEKEQKEEKDEVRERDLYYFNEQKQTRYSISFKAVGRTIEYIKLEKTWIPFYPSYSYTTTEEVEMNISTYDMKNGEIAVTIKGVTRKRENKRESIPLEIKYIDIETTIFAPFLPFFADSGEIEKSIEEQGIQKTFVDIIKSVKMYLTLGFPEV